VSWYHATTTEEESNVRCSEIAHLAEPSRRLASRHKSHHDIGGVSVEVLTPPGSMDQVAWQPESET